MRDQIEFIIAELRGMWRFRIPAILLAWLICIAGWAVVLWLPDTYASRAEVYVDTNSQLRPILDKLTVDTDVTDRLDLVTKALLGQQQLEDVVLATDLHLRAKAGTSLQDVAAGLRSRVSIVNNQRTDPNLYTLSYQDREPVMAKVVVETLLNNFVEKSLGANRLGSENAQRFLREELASLEQELEDAERRLAEFKRNNIGRMPDESGDYYTRLQNEMTAREELRAELSLLSSKKAALQAQLAGETPIVQGSAETGPIADIDTRISLNRQKLEELSLRFTDLHPDVVQTKSVIEELERRRAEVMDELASSGGSVASDNPVYQNIKIELNNIDVEMAAVAQREAAATRRITRLQDLVDVLPQVEAELQRLNRDYGVKQDQYIELSKRLEIAELSDSAEKSEDVKFQIINPPRVPVKPQAPNRPLLLAGVLLAGLGGGGALAFLFSQLRPVFHHATALSQKIGLPVLGTVATLDSVGRKRRRIAEVTVFGSGVVSLVAAFLLVLLFREQGVDFVQGIMTA